MDQVQKLRLRTYSTLVVTEEIKIPSDLAKSWIRSKLIARMLHLRLLLTDVSQTTLPRSPPTCSSASSTRNLLR